MAARFWPGMQCALEVVREVWKARVRELGASPKASKVQGEAAGKQPGTGVTSQHGMRGRQPARGSFYSGLCGLGHLPMVCERPAGSAWTGGHSRGKCSGPGLDWLRAEEQVPTPLCHHLGDVGRTLRPRRPSPHLAFVPAGL